MAIPGLSYDDTPCYGRIWLVTSYTTITQTKIRCDVPKDDWIAPEETHKYFKCDSDYKPFKGKKVKMSQQRKSSTSKNPGRLKAFGLNDAWLNIWLNFRNEYWGEFIKTIVKILSIDSYYKQVRRMFKGKCEPRFYSLFALKLKYLWEQKEKIRKNNWDIINHVRWKRYRFKESKQFTFHFNDDYFWRKHVGGFQLLFPPPEAFKSGFNHAKSLKFLGVKYVFVCVLCCVFV